MTTTTTRILQLSDLHIGPDDGPVLGIDARANLERALSVVKDLHFDLVVLTGDIAQDGSEAAYRYVADVTTRLPWTFVALAGNHDDPQAMRRAMPALVQSDNDGFLGFAHDAGDRRVVGLDTSTNLLPPQQLAWLERVVAGSVQPALVFLHHPPRPAGCRFMDRAYPLRNADVAWAALSSTPAVEHIFCGHYHTHRSVFADGRCLHLCPSTLGQLDPGSEDLVVEHTRPGWRIIEWDRSGLRTWVGYASADHEG